jgi:hypothetical protein
MRDSQKIFESFGKLGHNNRLDINPVAKAA